jgi:hypothetical protein
MLSGHCCRCLLNEEAVKHRLSSIHLFCRHQALSRKRRQEKLLALCFSGEENFNQNHFSLDLSLEYLNWNHFSQPKAPFALPPHTIR